jgi:hypothetical protein
MRAVAGIVIALGALVGAAACGGRTPLGDVAGNAGDGGSPVGIDASGPDSAPSDSAPAGPPDGSTTGCSPDGTVCHSDGECCVGRCSKGFCGLSSSCQEDGVICSNAAQCCSLACTNQLCGASNCAALGPSQCDTCTALSCCSQLGACEPDPGCLAYLQCLVSCEMDGGAGLPCSQGCASLGGSAASQLQQCVQQQCLTACTSG